MKHFSYSPILVVLYFTTSLLFSSLFLSSCYTPRQLNTETHIVTDTTTTRIDTIVHTRFVPYVTPEDSALIQLGLRCDSSGRVLLSNYAYEHSRVIGLQYSLDSLNNLRISARTNPDTILIPVQDTTIINENQRLKAELSQKQTTITEYVDKPLSWYNKIFLELGKLLSALVVILILVFVGRTIFYLYIRKV